MRGSVRIPYSGEAESPWLRDDGRRDQRDDACMDIVMDQIGSMGWLMSPVGIVAVVVVTALILSGIPGKVVLLISGRMSE